MNRIAFSVTFALLLTTIAQQIHGIDVPLARLEAIVQIVHLASRYIGEIGRCVRNQLQYFRVLKRLLCKLTKGNDDVFDFGRAACFWRQSWQPGTRRS
jgi:hypothetical protein